MAHVGEEFAFEPGGDERGFGQFLVFSVASINSWLARPVRVWFFLSATFRSPTMVSSSSRRSLAW